MSAINTNCVTLHVQNTSNPTGAPVVFADLLGTDLRIWDAIPSRAPQAGYLGYCAAIANADLTETTRTLCLPTLDVAGRHDGARLPDLVAATAAFILGPAFHTIEGEGHLPCVEDPLAFAAILNPFLEEHVYV